MGMFDTLMVPLTCPACGLAILTGCQTKDLNSQMDVIQVGEPVERAWCARYRYRWLHAVGSCPCGAYFDVEVDVDKAGRLKPTVRYRDWRRHTKQED